MLRTSGPINYFILKVKNGKPKLLGPYKDEKNRNLVANRLLRKANEGEIISWVNIGKLHKKKGA